MRSHNGWTKYNTLEGVTSNIEKVSANDMAITTEDHQHRKYT